MAFLLTHFSQPIRDMAKVNGSTKSTVCGHPAGGGNCTNAPSSGSFRIAFPEAADLQ
jgi:hypothetical protein